MRYLQLTGFIIFFLISIPSAVAEETRGKTDACLVTLYNYPAETPRHSALKKTVPRSTLLQEKNKRASKASETVYSWMSISPGRSGEK